MKRKNNGWISVDDGFPKTNSVASFYGRSKDVLVYDFFGGIFIGCYNIDLLTGEAFWYYNGRTHKAFEDYDEGKKYPNVTHWMPLPAPPKKGGEK